MEKYLSINNFERMVFCHGAGKIGGGIKPSDNLIVSRFANSTPLARQGTFLGKRLF
jgi:hypothetical protein